MNTAGHQKSEQYKTVTEVNFPELNKDTSVKLKGDT